VALLLIGAIKTFPLMLLANRELFVQVWPVLRGALDWSKVDALLKTQRNGK
jgi:hypothetical protein